jgi:RES domain-containing protein
LTNPRVLERSLRAYRIGDPDGAFPIFSGEGARQTPGRWNDFGQAMIYACEHYSTAMLEKLVRLGEMPPNQHFVEITIERGVSYEEINEAIVPGWYEENQAAARAFGSRWFAEGRSAFLVAPSVVAHMDMNVLINPVHPDARHIRAGRERPIWWDNRYSRRDPA